MTQNGLLRPILNHKKPHRLLVGAVVGFLYTHFFVKPRVEGYEQLLFALTVYFAFFIGFALFEIYVQNRNAENSNTSSSNQA